MELVNMINKCEGRIPKAGKNLNSETRAGFLRCLVLGFRISFDAIALPAASGNEIAPELFTNAEDVDVHEVGQCIVAFVEKMFVERRAGDDLATVQRQIFENRILT